MNDNLPEIGISAEIGEIAATMTTRAVENTENFIFRTIAPYCERATETKISKAELTDALMKQKARKPIYDAPILEAVRAYCPTCGRPVDAGKYNGKEFENNYCAHCGQKIDFEGGGADE